MSFGFSFGDFVTAWQLVEGVRKGFVEAPKQYAAILDEYVLKAYTPYIPLVIRGRGATKCLLAVLTAN